MMLDVLKRSAVGALAAALVGTTLAVSAATQAIGGTGITHEAALAAGSTVATVTVHGGVGAADHRMSVLVLDEDANLAAPAKADIVYLNEILLDGSGEATLTFALPNADLDAYAIAMNAGNGRYLASLDPAGTLPSTGGTPGTGGDPGAGGPGGPGSSGGGAVGSGSGSRGSSVRLDVTNGAVPSTSASGSPTRSSPTPSSAPATPSNTPPVAAPSSTEGGSGIGPWAVGGAALLLAVIAVGIWLFRRRASPSE